MLAPYHTQVHKRFNSPALQLEDGTFFTFGEIDVLAKKIQLVLGEQLVSVPDDVVGTPLVAVMMNRSVGFIVSILGILKAGAAYVPVDPAFPPDRQSYIFSHSKCQLLIADHESYNSAVQLGAELPAYLLVDSLTGEIDWACTPSISKRDLDFENIIPAVISSDTLAYVLYTSGSTGKPKGVMVKQISVSNIVNWFAEEMNLGPDSIVMGLTTFCFDISVLEIFLPLTRGGLLLLANSPTQKDPFHLIEIIDAFKVTVFQATPTTYEMMLATGWQGDPRIDFLVGGEAFRSSLLPLADKQSGRCRSLRNVYGPTETTIWSLSYTVPQAMASATGPVQVPIGSAISQTALYVVAEKENAQESWRQVGVGAEGELWIGGIGVAKGYLHAPALTQEKFLPNPFGDGVVYRTGDIVKQLPQPGGEFVFVRRMDDQVKVDGFRIELAEIETVYMQDDAVEQAVALVRNNKIVIYLKLSTSGRASAERLGEQRLIENLRTAAARALTYYMVPKLSLVVPSFPQTANGKIDRKALPDPPGLSTPTTNGSLSASVLPFAPASPGGSGVLGAGNSPSARMIAHICDVIEKLRDQRPRPNSSFASLGLDSLNSIMFIRALSISLGGLKIEPAALYSPGVTIRSFAKLIMERLEKENPTLKQQFAVVARSDSQLQGESDVEATLLHDPHRDHSDSTGTEEDAIVYTSESEDAFDAALVRNVRLLQGVRGVFTFMVLWDHFHYPLPISTTFTGDVSFFVFLSGFTTALQLRETPKFEYTNGVFKLKKRPPFNWRKFMLSRCLGIFPILWLALLLNAPFWYLQDNSPGTSNYDGHVKGLHQNKAAAVCTFLYMIGMQSWVRPQCAISGPNSVLYASIILNCFLFYCFVRYWVQWAQDRYMEKMDDNLVIPFTVQERFIDEEKGSTIRAITPLLPLSKGNLATYLSYNRPRSLRMAVAISASWFALMTVIFIIISAVGSLGKNGFIYFPYFFAGVISASLTEIWYYIRHRSASSSGQGVPMEVSSSRVGDSAVPFAATEPKRLSIDSLQSAMWRFTPDMLAVLCGFLMSTLGGLQNFSGQYFLQWLVVPYVILIFMIVSVLQDEEAGRNLSRLFLESSVMNFLGYISYTMYLFQAVILTWYAPTISRSASSHTNVFIQQGNLGDAQWFLDLNFGWRIFAILILSIFCWLVQRYYQDTFVLWLYNKLIELTTTYLNF